MQADKELLEGMENAINSIFDEAEDAILDDKSSYEVPVQTVDIEGHKCQVVVKLIVDPSKQFSQIETGEVYWDNREDSTRKEEVPSPFEGLDDEDDE